MSDITTAIDTITVNIIDDGWNIMSKNDIDFTALEEVITDNIKEKPNLPSNQRNSCYIDSVLVALFLTNNVLVTSMFLCNILPLAEKKSMFIHGETAKDDLKMRRAIQKTLIGIVKRIRQGSGDADGISTLRNLLGQCRFNSNFNLGTQEDASDFLSVLCQVFNIHDNQNEQQMTVIGTHDLLSTPPKFSTLTTDLVNSTGLIHHVFSWKPGCIVQDTLVHMLDSVVEPFSKSNYVRAITTTLFKPNLFFIVHIDRTATGKLNRSPLFIETSLETNGHKFKLISIVLHSGTIGGGHYICLVLQDRNLFVFDDLSQTLELSKLTSQEIAEQCVLVFYSV